MGGRHSPPGRPALSPWSAGRDRRVEQRREAQRDLVQGVRVGDRHGRATGERELEPLPAGGTVTVEGRCDGDGIEIEISNPVSATARAVRSGNRMALDNIRQRLDLAFGGRASVAVDDTGEQYRVTLRFPLLTDPAGAGRSPW